MIFLSPRSPSLASRTCGSRDHGEELCLGSATALRHGELAGCSSHQQLHAPWSLPGGRPCSPLAHHLRPQLSVQATHDVAPVLTILAIRVGREVAVSAVRAAREVAVWCPKDSRRKQLGASNLM